MSSAELVCANRQCRVALDGKCLEGYDDLSACPFHGRQPDDVVEAQGDPVDTPDPFDGTYLPKALALTRDRADRVLTIFPSRMIGIIGVHDSGKTSIIAGLYDLFQIGPVADITFAGSSTLHGLEQICHDARVASERNEPHSERTKRGEVRFYHIDVCRQGVLQSFLIADRSGEEYEEVADLAVNASAMFELRRADVITVLVDGVRLANPAERADAMGAIPLIIQGMVENGAFARMPSLAVVLTKDDAVQSSPHKDRVERDFKAIIERLELLYSDYFAEIQGFRTSASPKDAAIPRGMGLADLIKFWLSPRLEAATSIIRHTSGRIFDQLTAQEADVG